MIRTMGFFYKMILSERPPPIGFPARSAEAEKK